MTYPDTTSPTALFPRLAAADAIATIRGAVPWFGSVWDRSPADQQDKVLAAVTAKIGEGLLDLVSDLRTEWDDQLRHVQHKCGWCSEPGTSRMQVTLTGEPNPREAHACRTHSGELVAWATA